MERELLLPTSWSKQRLAPLLQAILWQTQLPGTIRFLLHTSAKEQNLWTIQAYIKQSLSALTDVELHIMHEENADYQSWHGVWYDRNFLVHQAQSEYLYMIDDDNVFEETFFEECIGEVANLAFDEFLWSPQVEWRTSWTIQSAWISWFRWWLPTFVGMTRTWNRCVKMLGANSLFGPTMLFQKIWFDARYRSCLEDIDFSYRVSAAGVPIVVSDWIRIQHMEREKSLLEKKFLWSQ